MVLSADGTLPQLLDHADMPTRELRRPFRTPSLTLGREAGFAGAAFALAIAMFGTTLPTPLYGLYREEFGFSELMITVIFATYAAGVIASLLVFGSLSDQIGRRRVLLPGLALAALSAVAFLVADGLALLLVGRILSGLSAGIFTGTATATLLDLAAPGRRARAALVATIANMGGLGCGALLAALLSQWAGSPLRLIFWVDLALLVPAAIAIWAMPEPVVARSRPRLRPHAAAQRVRDPRRVPGADRRDGVARARSGGLVPGAARARWRDRRIRARRGLPGGTGRGERQSARWTAC
jgi:MFS family permease